MRNPSQIRRTAIRAAFVVSSMLLSSAAIAGGAPAQSLPVPELQVQPTQGIGVATGPDGAKVDLDVGNNGGVHLEAGPGGVNLDARRPRTQIPVVDEPAQPVSTPPRQPADQTPGSGNAPQDGSRGGGPGGVIDEVGGGSGRATDRGAARRGAPHSGDRSGTAGAGPQGGEARKAAGDDDGNGVAPVFDLIERIPAAVRAGLVALALIALALWALWIRGRRRLENNAYQDPVTGVANMAAFEQVLAREWRRAARYQRPLGLVLLDLGERGGRGFLGDRDARAAVKRINWEVRESDTVARLAPSRFAVISPEAPQASIETLAHALAHRLEEQRLRCWAGVAERSDSDANPAELVTRAAAVLADAHAEMARAEPDEAEAEYQAPVLAAERTPAAA
jgi:diguanylate cyclase (GGDEF)-like protein